MRMKRALRAGGKSGRFTSYKGVQNVVVHFTNEMLEVYGYDFDNEEVMKLFKGTGIVREIIKGEDFDLVVMNFGSRYDRNLIVREINARKQIYTLKVNQYAEVIGRMKCVKNKENKSVMVMYATCLQGYYVPKSFDIKHTENIDDFMKMTEDNKNETEDLLSKFEK